MNFLLVSMLITSALFCSEQSENSVESILKNIVETKQTNLCLSADVTDKAQLLSLADTLGDQICALKVHIDTVSGVDDPFLQELKEIAEKRNFLLIEDRKFADIGNTVQHQYKGGDHKIVTWAHLVTAYAAPGEGIVKALQNVASEHTKTTNEQRGMLLIAELSSQNNLLDSNYSHETLAIAEKYRNFVTGVINQNKYACAVSGITFTPGIQFKNKHDQLDQNYKSPEEAINTGTDIIIVGRGIYQAKNPLAETKKYREAGWDARQKRMQK